MLSWLGYFPHHYWHHGEEPDRVGMRHHYIAPYGPYLAGDGVYVSLVVATAHDWDRSAAKSSARPDLLDDERFRSAETRRRHRDDLERIDRAHLPGAATRRVDSTTRRQRSCRTGG